MQNATLESITADDRTLQGRTVGFSTPHAVVCSARALDPYQIM